MKVTDTNKRVLKFEGVAIQDSELMDEEGSLVAQIIQNLPSGVEYFDVQVTMQKLPADE